MLIDILQVYTRASSEVSVISQNWDRSIDSLVWLPDNSGFYVTVGGIYVIDR